jgi:hypothetical protein
VLTEADEASGVERDGHLAAREHHAATDGTAKVRHLSPPFSAASHVASAASASS